MSNNPTADLISYILTVATVTGAPLPTVEHWNEIRAKAIACQVSPWGVDAVTKEPLPYPGIGGYYPEGYTRTTGVPFAYSGAASAVTGRWIHIQCPAPVYPHYEFITTGINDRYHGPLMGQGNMNTITYNQICFT